MSNDAMLPAANIYTEPEATSKQTPVRTFWIRNGGGGGGGEGLVKSASSWGGGADQSNQLSGGWGANEICFKLGSRWGWGSRSVKSAEAASVHHKDHMTISPAK